MDPNGTNQVRVTNLPGDDAADDQWPCFDDTGNFIAYQSTAEDPADPDAVEDTDIWVVEIANPANRTNLTKGVQNSSNQGAPSWSPDGTKILYHDDRAGSFDIWVMDSNGSNMTQLVDNPLSQGFPVWYSDGSRFAFVEARAIWTAAADGSDLTQVTRSLVQP
jgi:Tol biopolymer transport system component